MLMIANSVDVSNVPNEIKILPIGNIESRKGNFKVDDESIQLIINGFKKRRLDLVIDYEHQTLDNVQAPAAGWIKDIYLNNDALVAKVEWTNRAKDYLTNKEYRYLSPVILARNPDRKAVLLHSVALTNTPAIDGMFPIINSLGNEIEKSTNVSTESEDDLLSTLRELLNLPDSTGIKELMSILQSLIKEKSKAESELHEMKHQAFEQQIDDVILHALKTGKISTYMKDSARKMAFYDLEAFKSYLDSAPTIVPMGEIAYDDDFRKVSDNSKICNLLGISNEELVKYNY